MDIMKIQINNEVAMVTHTSINNKVSPHKAWAKTQSKTLDHKIAIVLYSIICAFAIIKTSWIGYNKLDRFFEVM